MGEVGISSEKNPTDSFNMNGDMNGSYDDENDDQMEVDPLESPSQNLKKPDSNFDSQSKKDSHFSEDEDEEKSNLTENSSSIKNLDEKSQSCSSVQEEDFDDRNNDDTNLTANGGDSTNMDKTNNDEIHDIDDSDDDIDDDDINDDKIVNTTTTNLHGVNESLDLDRTSNGHMSVDDDKPVSIHSDSDSDVDDGSLNNRPKSLDISVVDNKKQQDSSAEKDAKKCDNNNTNGGEIHEILSDKEDCIVVEDEKKEDISPRRSQRQRKSVVKVRNFADFDDDIEEIKGDPLQNSSSKNVNKNLNNIRNTISLQASVSSPFGQGNNQISIKDARSLAVSQSTTITKSSGNNIFSQSNLQQQLNSNNNKKEPALVIIDTNQILSHRAGVQQSLNRNSFSVLPVGVPAQGLYPTNMRASITSISKSLQLNQTNITPSLLQAQINQTSTAHLLPALTDDMFVLEAPSFIVPYIYEKPPSENLREIITKIGVEIEESKKADDADKKSSDADGSQEKSKSNENSSSKGATGDSNKDDGKADDSENSKKRKRKTKNGDDSWDESDTSTDDEASDAEQRTKILIKEIKEDIDDIKKHIITPESAKEAVSTPAPVVTTDPAKKDNYFESPLGKFFMTIGINLVQEHVQTDLLRQQKKKINREGGTAPPNIQVAINSLMKNLEVSRERNEPFKFDMKRCEYCNFKSESSLAMAHHYETPHMKNYIYKCNFCTFETRPPHDILFHMEAVHNIKGRLEKAVSYHQCPNCPFEDNGKSKLMRHSVVCAKKFRPEVNLAPPADWEPPAKIPRIKPKHGLVGTATAYQAMAAQQQRASTNTLPRANPAQANAMLQRGRILPNRPGQGMVKGGISNINLQQGRNVQRNSGVGSILPQNFTTNQYLQQLAGAGNVGILPNFHSSLTVQSASGPKTAKSVQQPSISITPLPRQSSSQSSSVNHLGGAIAKPPGMANLKPGQSPNGNGKNAFVICEICDGYIKDLDQLRNHMQWIHKIKIHPKMIYNRPPLNCQKCQYRFFTDQGLERHLLGSHGLVTSSMQEAANKGKDAGRCPVCGRIYQWKLLNHVSRDHSMTLKPAHLSYKCTVCTATFGMYKQFENHVYSAHSTVAKKSMDSRKNPSSSNTSNSNHQNKMGGDSILKPLKINDEITIIPQPATKTLKSTEIESHVID